LKRNKRKNKCIFENKNKMDTQPECRQYSIQQNNQPPEGSKDDQQIGQSPGVAARQPKKRKMQSKYAEQSKTC
jgi:hypothetical protein